MSSATSQRAFFYVLVKIYVFKKLILKKLQKEFDMAAQCAYKRRVGTKSLKTLRKEKQMKTYYIYKDGEPISEGGSAMDCWKELLELYPDRTVKELLEDNILIA